MKVLFTLVGILAASAAQATPKVGDLVVYDLKMGLDGQSAEGILQVELADFDALKNAYLEKQLFALQGEAPQATEEWKSADDYLNDQTIDAILTNCQGNGGLSQKIFVGAGEFDTCAITFDNEESKGVIWIGKVPFGTVKMEQIRKDNNLSLSSSIKSFK